MSIKTLSALKKQSKKTFEKISTELDNMTKSSYNNDDDRFWQPTVDKHGNGFAIIRFLPAPQGEDVPVVRYYDHGFQGPTGQWYIEKSLTSIGKDDPVSEMNSDLWNTGLESNKEIVRKRKRKVRYVSNIQVVKDSDNTENEGKVFLYRFGTKIFEKIKNAMHPEFEDEEPFNPYDFWDGAEFKLKIRKKDGFRNYDASEWGDKKPIADDDDEIQKIWDSEYSLGEFLDPSTYKTYDELKARLNKILGTNAGRSGDTVADAGETDDIDTSAMDSVEGDFEVDTSGLEDDDDTTAFFNELVKD